MTRNLRINYIELPASDLNATEKFYSKTFGWTFTDYGPGYRAFNDGSLDGGFFKSPLSSRTESGGALVILHTDQLEQALEAVLKHGGTVVKEIFDFPGGRRFHFADPNGNELAVWCSR